MSGESGGTTLATGSTGSPNKSRSTQMHIQPQTPLSSQNEPPSTPKLNRHEAKLGHSMIGTKPTTPLLPQRRQQQQITPGSISLLNSFTQHDKLHSSQNASRLKQRPVTPLSNRTISSLHPTSSVSSTLTPIASGSANSSSLTNVIKGYRPSPHPTRRTS